MFILRWVKCKLRKRNACLQRYLGPKCIYRICTCTCVCRYAHLMGMRRRISQERSKGVKNGYFADPGDTQNIRIITTSPANSSYGQDHGGKGTVQTHN